MAKTKKKRTVQATLNISDEAISDIAVTAIEGGIGYWSIIDGYDCTNLKNFGELTPSEDEDDFAHQFDKGHEFIVNPALGPGGHRSLVPGGEPDDYIFVGVSLPKTSPFAAHRQRQV